MVNYSTVQIRAETLAFMRQVFKKGESIDKGIRRLLIESGYQPNDDSFIGRAVPRETKYRLIETLKIGQRCRLHWRGNRDPMTGAFYDTQQNWAFMAVARIERKTGFVFSKGDDGEGMLLTRIK